MVRTEFLSVTHMKLGLMFNTLFQIRRSIVLQFLAPEHRSVCAVHMLHENEIGVSRTKDFPKPAAEIPQGLSQLLE